MHNLSALKCRNLGLLDLFENAETDGLSEINHRLTLSKSRAAAAGWKESLQVHVMEFNFPVKTF